MDPKSHRLGQRQTESTSAVEHSTQRGVAREFGSVEEVLRTDRSQTAVPPALAQQVADAVRGVQETRRPWWARWIGREERS